jgi:ATP-dependent Clp protease ATP-binding subunit ClpA
VFERFTEPARQVVVLAQEEARLLAHHHIGTEHLLIAIVREPNGSGGRVLEALGLDARSARAAVSERVGRGPGASAGQIPFTPRAKKVLELALREALSLGHNHIGTEHLLLGLVLDDSSVAVGVLSDVGVTPHGVREAVINALGLTPPGRADATPKPLVPLSDLQRALRLLEAAAGEAIGLGDEGLASEHLLLALAAQESEAADLLARHGLTHDFLREELALRRRKR